MGRLVTLHNTVILEHIITRLTRGIGDMRNHLADIPLVSHKQRLMIIGIIDIGRTALRDAKFKRAAALAEMEVSGFATIAKQDRERAFFARKNKQLEAPKQHKYQPAINEVSGFGNVGTPTIAQPTAQRDSKSRFSGYITHPWRGGRRR